MATVEDLAGYFTKGVKTESESTWGMEVETFLVAEDGGPAQAEHCQTIFSTLEHLGWLTQIDASGWINEVKHEDGTIFRLEQGYHCIEQVSSVTTHGLLLGTVYAHQATLYGVLDNLGLYAVRQPILQHQGNLLAPEDPRSAMWLALDGVKSGNIPARTASVQFTFAVSPVEAIDIINRLNAARGQFLSQYPQDALWHQHMATSHAGYRHDRYGGPGYFKNLEHYCQHLAQHWVIAHGDKLVPIEDVGSDNGTIASFIKSVWWYFRLKRYGDTLCIEVRPLPRLVDDQFAQQFALVRQIVGH